MQQDNQSCEQFMHMENRKKLRKFSGIMFIFTAAILAVALVASFCYDIPYLPRRVFLRTAAITVYTILYLIIFLITYPKVFI